MWSKKCVTQKINTMSTRKIFSFFLLLAGEALIIISFLHFGKNFDEKILTLNIVVSSIIYSLLFFSIIIPLVDFKDKSQRTVGSIGIKGFSTLIYVVLAVAVIVVFNEIVPLDFKTQIIIHGILFLMLLFGMCFTLTASNKVHEVFVEETKNRSYLEDMKKIANDVQLKLEEMENVPKDIISSISVLKEDLRFISPCNNDEAHALEINFISEIKLIQNSLSDNPFNYDKVIEYIKNCKRIYKERKQILSN